MKQEKRREMGTFVIHVQNYENFTWQGEVVWADHNKVQKFRSTLELLKLIDSALEPGTRIQALKEET